jgi:hypothetical protein
MVTAAVPAFPPADAVTLTLPVSAALSVPSDEMMAFAALLVLQLIALESELPLASRAVALK